MPVRKIPKNYRNVTGLLASKKNDSMAAFESTLERDLMLTLEFDETVASYEEQPVLINYADSDGKPHTYTPDLLIIYRSDLPHSEKKKSILCEVKYRKDLFKNWKILKPKFKAARRYAYSKEWKFQIMTEVEIRTPLVSNARFLIPFKRLLPDMEKTCLILNKMHELGETTPKELLDKCSSDFTIRAELIPILWHLVAIRQIGTDFNFPLNMSSLIKLCTDVKEYKSF